MMDDIFFIKVERLGVINGMMDYIQEQAKHKDIEMWELYEN